MAAHGRDQRVGRFSPGGYRRSRTRSAGLAVCGRGACGQSRFAGYRGHVSAKHSARPQPAPVAARIGHAPRSRSDLRRWPASGGDFASARYSRPISRESELLLRGLDGHRAARSRAGNRAPWPHRRKSQPAPSRRVCGLRTQSLAAGDRSRTGNPHRIAGRAPRFFRAPAGLRSPLLDPVLARLGLTYVSWTRRGLDTIDANPATVLRRLARGLSAGDVLTLHDRPAVRTSRNHLWCFPCCPRCSTGFAPRISSPSRSKRPAMHDSGRTAPARADTGSRKRAFACRSRRAFSGGSACADADSARLLRR